MRGEADEYPQHHAAQEHDRPERSACLAGACGSDDDLKREIEFVLAQK